jgi:small-conductance mechanosensitive channel
MPDWLHSAYWKHQTALLANSVPRAVYQILLTLALYALARWALGRVISAVVAAVIQRSARGREAQAARLRTMQGLLRSVANYLLAFIAGISVLQAVGLNVGALLLGAGVAGMAVGFGAQRLVRDVITGFFILMEDQYSVGDRVTIGAVTGEVTEFGMRTTRLRDDVGNLVILANGDISSVTNRSRGPLVAAVDVTVGRDTDIDLLRQKLDQAEFNLDTGPLVEKPRLAGIASLEAATMTIRVVAEARPGNQQEAEMHLRQKINEVTSAP